MAKAGPSSSRTTPIERPSGFPSAPGKFQGQSKCGGKRGIPPSKRLAIVSTRNPGTLAARIDARIAASVSATSGPGTRRVMRGHTIRTSNVNAPIAASGQRAVSAAPANASIFSGKCSGDDAGVRPKKSRSCRPAMTTAIPAVNPVVTGCGMNWINRPRRNTPNAKRINPARSDAVIKPPSPCVWLIGPSSTTNAAVGPETLTREPPATAMIAPATMDVYRPCCGGTPEAIASAIASGSATMPTTAPARMSRRRSRAP